MVGWKSLVIVAGNVRRPTIAKSQFGQIWLNLAQHKVLGTTQQKSG